MDHASRGILNRLIGQFQQLTAELERLRAQVRPSLDIGVLGVLLAPPDVARFALRPVVFNLPERAGSGRSNLYVVVEGRFSFLTQAFLEQGALRTFDFETRVGYFRRDADALVHVFGAHYDIDLTRLGHPVFHAQVKGFPEFAVHVRHLYFHDDPVPDRNCLEGLLKTIRIPIAQLDVFSLFLQLCADHLLHNQSGPEEKAAFNQMLNHVTFCQGAAFQVPRLGTEEARTCYRARHWYPVIA